MLQVGILTVEKVAMLLLFIAAGYLLRITDKVPKYTGRLLSVLTSTVFAPAYGLRALWSSFTLEKIAANGRMFLWGLLFTFITIGVGQMLSHLLTRDKFEQHSLDYILSYPNVGYFGYPVIEGVFGTEVLAMTMVFLIPVNFSINTYGYQLFVPEGKVTLRRVLLSPPTLGSLGGIALGLLGVPQPRFLVDSLTLAGSCMSPVAMLVAGIVLGGYPLKKLLTGGKSYLISAFRLVFIPAIMGAVLWMVGVRDLLLTLPIMLFSLPAGMNCIVYPESQGLDASENARTCFVTTLLSVLTLPVVFAIAKALM